MLDFLYWKRGRENLPEKVTDALCCMAATGQQWWQIGTARTLHYLAEVYCKGLTIQQCWTSWLPSQLGVPAPYGELRSQKQLLTFLGSLVQVWQHC